MLQLMTAAEIHDFGVEVVFKYLRDEDYEILAVSTALGVNPQITARKAGKLAFIVVRTACYPGKGRIASKAEAMQCIAHADKHRAICYFASVGIANASGAPDQEMSQPVKGAGFHVAYEGLVVLTSSDRCWNDPN